MTVTHRMSKSKEYRKWWTARDRCRNPRNSRFPYYGGRGICFSRAWEDFMSFYAEMGPLPSPDHELDRIDNNGNYEPGNCRWATRPQQVRNTRRTVLSADLVADLREHVAAGGQVRAWAKSHGINEQTAYNVTSRGAWKPLDIQGIAQ